MNTLLYTGSTFKFIGGAFAPLTMTRNHYFCAK